MEMEFMLTEGALRIPCKVCEPVSGNIRRIVLGVHGIGGSTDDAIQSAMAEEMGLFHSVTFRFDFPAHGKSPMQSDEFSLKACKQALAAVAAEARRRYPEVEDLCIFASGFGAYVTLLTLDEILELPGKVKLVVQTPSVRMHDTLLTMLRRNRETFWAMDSLVLRAPRPLELTYRFYEELETNVAMNTCPIPMLILHGEEDAYIRREDIDNFNRINEDAKLVIIPGTTHQFLEDGAWDMVLDLVRDWFMYEDVLLCDGE